MFFRKVDPLVIFFILVVPVMVAIFIALIFTLSWFIHPALLDDGRVKAVAERTGLTEVVVGNGAYNECRSDEIGRYFTGVNVRGETVIGLVCCPDNLRGRCVVLW